LPGGIGVAYTDISRLMTYMPRSPTRPSADSTPRRATSLSARVVEAMAARIREGALKPGERMPTEPALMHEFGVSRSVVREALSRLQAGGLVRTHQGVGSFVLDPPPAASLPPADPESLNLQHKLAMLELRLSLESDAAALAAQRRSADQLAAMERALDDFDAQIATGEVTAEADFRFHELIAQATGNEYFVQVLRSLGSATIPRRPVRLARRAGGDKARRFGEPSPLLRSRKDVTAAEHRAVLDAIRRGDASSARAAMYLHLNNSRERMKSVSG
jgi:DNA-binding FadR family transcriptional regulator